MRRFKNILFMFEDTIESDPALRRAEELARGNDATLTLAHCVEAVPTDDVGVGGSAWSGLQDEWKAQLEALAEPVRAQGVDVETVVASGIPFREVIGLVQNRGHDLVVKAAREPGGPRQLVFGSTDLHLLRKCPCPVWIHRDREPDAHYGRIMAAVDISDGSQDGKAMTRMVLDLATSLGQIDDSDVHVVHAWTSLGERMASAARRGLMPAAEIAQEVAAEGERRQELFKAALAPYLELPVRLHLHLVHGDPREVLPLFARDRDMALIVMGTLARTGIPGFFMGNTAEEVLRQVDSSVLTMKPDGFLSPVA